MRIVFLDIDGVLNSRNFLLKCREISTDGNHAPDSWIDPIAVARLNQITNATGADIVVSSTWRLEYLWSNRIADLRGLLKRHGITAKMRGVTPDHSGRTVRGDEIKVWLNDWNGFVDQFVILDDEDDMGDLIGSLIQTDDGLNDDHVEMAIQRLLKDK